MEYFTIGALPTRGGGDEYVLLMVTKHTRAERYALKVAKHAKRIVAVHTDQ